jgi:hypothetical protein
MRTPTTRARLLMAAGTAASLLLLVVGLSAGWPLVLLLLTAGSLVVLGFALAADRLHGDQVRLRAQRQALDAEWQTLEQTRRVRSVFLAARRAMQAEARDAGLSPDSDERGQDSVQRSRCHS